MSGVGSASGSAQLGKRGLDSYEEIEDGTVVEPRLKTRLVEEGLDANSFTSVAAVVQPRWPQ